MTSQSRLYDRTNLYLYHLPNALTRRTIWIHSRMRIPTLRNLCIPLHNSGYRFSIALCRLRIFYFIPRRSIFREILHPFVCYLFVICFAYGFQRTACRVLSLNENQDVIDPALVYSLGKGNGYYSIRINPR